MSIVEGYRFPKSARLTSNTAISTLYEKGRRGGVKPLRFVLYAESLKAKEGADEGRELHDADLCDGSDVEAVGAEDSERRVKVLISVPKRIFKRAVMRNRLKRRIRESYRLHYSRLEELAAKNNISISLAIMYGVDQELEFVKIDNAVEKIISNIEKYY